MNHSHRLLSAPIDVVWGGWTATTTQLQQAGWEISAEQDIQYATLRIALRHRDFRMYGLSQRIPVDYFEMARRNIPMKLTIRIEHMASQLNLNIIETSGLSGFAPVDAYPQMVDTQRKSIEDFKIFATPLARTEEIIVDPSQVGELLEKIKKAQAQGQSEIRERNRLRAARESYEPMPRQQFHAQILSFERAA